MAEMLDFVRVRIRRSSTKLDELELVPLIEAAKTNLAQAGVVVISDTDPLTQAAVALFCQWIIERDDGIRSYYEALRDGMALNSRYNGASTCADCEGAAGV